MDKGGKMLVDFLKDEKSLMGRREEMKRENILLQEEWKRRL